MRPINYLAHVLRPPDHRRPRGGAVAGRDQGSAGRSGAPAARSLRRADRWRRLSRNRFDVVVIGAGPGGYIAAIRAAQLGLHDGLHRRLDARRTASPRRAAPAPTSAASRRRRCCSPPRTSSTRGTRSPTTASRSRASRSTCAQMLARKDKVVAQNNDGILFLFKKNKVAFFHGRGAFAGGSADAAGRSRSTARSPPSSRRTHVIVATGSTPRALPGVAVRQRARARQRRRAGACRRCRSGSASSAPA